MFAYCNNNSVMYHDNEGNSAELPPIITKGLNLPASGGIPVEINGPIYYYAIKFDHGQLYEYWFDADGNLIWGRHHSDHNKPWKHDNPHDHQGGKDEKGNNTLVNGPQPVDEKYHAPKQNSSLTKSNETTKNIATGIVVGVVVYQVAKWALATISAPVTGGASYYVASVMP